MEGERWGANKGSTTLRARASASDESLHRWRIRELATASVKAKTSQDGGEEGGAALEASVGGGCDCNVAFTCDGAEEDGRCMLHA